MKTIIVWLAFILPAVLATSYQDKLRDYSCYHSYSWMKNTAAATSSLFSSAFTDITSSGYVGARRRLQLPPPPPSGGGTLPPPPSGTSTSAPTTPLLSTGWQVSFSGIPSYLRNISLWDMNLLNNRPKKSTDFSGGKTSVKVGQSVVFGASIGYSSTGCSMGYWPPGPGCPSDMKAKYVFPISPAPEASSSGCYAGLELGYFVNGVPIWNWADTTSYNSEGVWHNMAMKFEFYDVDICFGHAAQGEYHQQLGDKGAGHSPIHGFAYDGYPIMGPYQAARTLAVSCWQARDFSASSPTGCSDGKRSCLLSDPFNYKSGTTTASKAGPVTTATVSTQSGNTISASSGVYFEDFFFNSTCAARGGQYLDSHNGHDHDGIGYHYHLTMDSAGIPTFPYSVGPKYYGCLQSGSQSCGTSYLYGASLNTISYSKGTSTCGATSAVGSTCTSASWTMNGSPSPSKAPTKSPTIVPILTTPTTAPSVDLPSSLVPTYVSPTFTPSSPPSIVVISQPPLNPSLSPISIRSPVPIVSTAPTVYFQPTMLPSFRPSKYPTFRPINSIRPTQEPSVRPTQTSRPTQDPTFRPTKSTRPTQIPTIRPTRTGRPTQSPTIRPSREPTIRPTRTTQPSRVPTRRPSPQQVLQMTMLVSAKRGNNIVLSKLSEQVQTLFVETAANILKIEKGDIAISSSSVPSSLSNVRRKLLGGIVAQDFLVNLTIDGDYDFAVLRSALFDGSLLEDVRELTKKYGHEEELLNIELVTHEVADFSTSFVKSGLMYFWNLLGW